MRISLWLCMGGVLAWRVLAQAPSVANEAYRVYLMVQRAQAYLDGGNVEPGVKLLQDVPRLFPASEARFEARLALALHYMQERQFALAVDELVLLKRSEEEEMQAEGLYRTGICKYELGQYDEAFVALRKVTNDFPWSVWANEAYYYIGLCHFKMERWARAYDALQMVGVSVPTNVAQTVGEAGRRIWVKVADRDLVALQQQAGAAVSVQLRAASGDQEALTLAPMGQNGTTYLGSIETVSGKARSGDGVLQFIGPDAIEVGYVDATTGDGRHAFQRITTLTLASTASVGFTDGAFRDYVQTARLNHPLFIRLKDFDGNQSPAVDELKVTIRSEREVEAQETDLIGLGLGSEQRLYETRDSLEVSLRESGERAGTFVGEVLPVPSLHADGAVSAEDEVLHAQVGDRIVVAYADLSQPTSQDVVVLTGAAEVLSEAQQDVEITQWVVNDVELKASKHLIESQIQLRLAQIFKEVGLQDKADERAEEGLERISEVIRLAVNGNLPQVTLEEAFHAKWDLQLVQDDLSAAVGTCNTLLRLYPESRIADRALLEIGKAKLSSQYEKDWQEALEVFKAVLKLAVSDLKPEAQFSLAQALEKLGRAKQRNRDKVLLPQGAVMAYRTCADQYPESAFAGRSLEKVVTFYIASEDYQRAADLMELVFQDFVDASFLDVMLLKWAIAAQKLGQTEVARQKLNRLIAEYPSSKVVRTAIRFRDGL